MKSEEMPILHSALTSIISQVKLPTLLQPTQMSEECAVEMNESESEAEGEVITIYISPSDSNDASSVEHNECTVSVSSSDNEISDAPEIVLRTPKKCFVNKRYLGDFSNIFSGNLKFRWNTAKAKVDLQRKKIKALQQSNRRLKNQIAHMKSILTHLQKQ